MVSTGTFSIVLFADRTLLLWHDGKAMSASMAGGNLFWVMTCLPIGIASMTGAIVSQYVGAGQAKKIGRFLWQAVWFSLLSIPAFALIGVYAPELFRITQQPEDMIRAESLYMRILLVGGVGAVLESSLSGFFSGTERTATIMWVSLLSGLLNLVLDYVLIFGFGPIPVLGIAGAGIASSAAFWFKGIAYGAMILASDHQRDYGIKEGLCLDRSLLQNLLFFGFPTGLMYVTEAGGFTAIILRIGRLGEISLRATTMAINFNMIAFIPLVGLSIAASVLVGRHLLESGARRATQSVFAALLLGIAYAALWCVAYVIFPETLMDLYRMNAVTDDSAIAMGLGATLLGFVAMYAIVDAIQLIVAGALRGAGDTWFVLATGIVVSVFQLTVGIVFEPESMPNNNSAALHWWWWMITIWVWLLGIAMTLRFAAGNWKRMRMV